MLGGVSAPPTPPIPPPPWSSRTFSDRRSKLSEVLLNTRLGGIKISNQSAYEAEPVSSGRGPPPEIEEGGGGASQLGHCWFDLEVLQLHGQAHVPRDLQLPLKERLSKGGGGGQSGGLISRKAITTSLSQR